METKSSFSFGSLASKISDGLKKAQVEIEEMAVQLSLGKADATDKFEEIKKDFKSKVNEWKQAYADMKTAGGEKAFNLKTKLEELQVQLALGKAEAKDVFEEQKKKILHAITELETAIKSDAELNKHFADFRNEAEKFKIKAEILKLKFELKKLQMNDSFKNEMADAKKEIDKLFIKAEEKWDKTKSNYADFSDEIDLAYKHFKKAVKSL